jgi:hypothetical protein
VPQGIDDTGFPEWAQRFYRSGQSLDRFERDFLALAEARGWLTLLPADGGLRRDRITVLYRAICAGLYSRERLHQLAAGGFSFWVYRTGTSLQCAEAHRYLDGLALPPSDPFWHHAFPPNDWDCSCYVVGARNEAGVRRLGGRPGKLTPRPAIPAAFRLTGGPPPEAVLAAVLDGSAL